MHKGFETTSPDAGCQKTSARCILFAFPRAGARSGEASPLLSRLSPKGAQATVRVLLLLLLLLLVPTVGLARSPDPPASPDALWSKRCANCHGETGEADTRMGRKYEVKSLATTEWQSAHDDADIRSVIRHGKKGTRMKAYDSKLTPQEIDALVQHVRTFAPER